MLGAGFIKLHHLFQKLLVMGGGGGGGHSNSTFYSVELCVMINLQTSLNNSQRKIAKMAECFDCCETF